MSFDVGGITVSSVDTAGMLVGSWFSAITWGVEAFQLATYLTRFNKDSIVLRTAVIFLFSLDTAWNVMLYVAAHHHLVEVEPGSMSTFVPSLTLVSAPTLSSIVIFGVNLFLIYRYRKLTQRTWISALLLLIAVASCACHELATFLALDLQKLDLSDLAKWGAAYKKATNVAKAGLGLEVTMVCSIWLLILFHLLSLLRQDMVDARRIITRLAIVTLESGTAASALSIATLVYYLGHPSSSNSIIIGFFMARVYFMNMIFNLNMRGSGGLLMRDLWAQSRVHHLPGGPVDSNDMQLAHLQSLAGGDRSGIQHSVVHVSQSVATHVDQEKGYGSKGRDPEDHL